MKPRTDSDVAPWLEKRDGDLAAMQVLLDRAPQLVDAIRFHAQQAAEKSLKALLLAATSREPPWVQDLVLLLRLLRDAVPELGVSPRDGEILTPFATFARYPRPTEADAAPVDVAVAACRRIVAAVDAAFEKHDRSSSG